MSALDFSYHGYMSAHREMDSQAAYRAYMLDSGRVEYGASLVNRSISANTDRVIGSINSLGDRVVSSVRDASNQISSSIDQAAEAICGKLGSIDNKLDFLNRKLDIVIEQHRMTNMLLQNIAEILKIPESEKERQHTIAMAIKFLANASSDPNLYDDALEEFLKAESMQKQDYFVLHRIGMIYLFSSKNLDPAKACDYFIRAAKYAKVESDSNSARLINVLFVQNNAKYINTVSNPEKIKMLVADSYGKAAFSLYVLGDIQGAIEQQSLAYNYDSSEQNLFLLAKYQSHFGDMEHAVDNLRMAIQNSPILAEAVFHEVDMMERPEIIQLVQKMNQDVTSSLLSIREKNYSDSVNRFINSSLESSYSTRISALSRLQRRGIN